MVERQHDAGECRRPDEGGPAARAPLVEQLLGSKATKAEVASAVKSAAGE